MPANVTSAMLAAGYKELAYVASQRGYSFAFGMLSQSDVQAILTAVFQAMSQAAPAPQQDANSSGN